jgi:toxin ParE1/3/4
MPEIAFRTNADEEMRTAAAYYEVQERGLGDQFLDEVEEGLQRIQQFPRLWPIYEGDYRRYLLKAFRLA